jgi:transcription initiation factor TFIIIB Brf1 subunit/transcription initiation factor TFIIB
MKKCSYCGRDNTDEALKCNECGTEFEREAIDSESTSGKNHDQEKTLTVRIFPSHEAAELAASKLEAHGIRCWVDADDCGGMYPNLTAAAGARLHVLAADVEVANTLLDTQASPAEIEQIESEAVASSPPETVPQKKLALGQIFIGIVVGIILCLLYQWNSKSGTKTHYHYTEDGKADEAWIYRDGHLVEFREDRNHDGEWDHRDYYEHGQSVRSEYDDNFDGKPDLWWTFSDGGTDTVQIDTDFNGVPDEFGVYKNKIIQQLDIKPNGSKFTVTHENFQNGVLTEIWRGGDSNGNFKEIVKYDPFFNPISTNISTAFQLSPSPK